MLVRGVMVSLACRVGEEPDDLIYEKLPHDIANRHVLLMDPILGTGNTVARALQVQKPTIFSILRTRKDS